MNKYRIGIEEIRFGFSFVFVILGIIFNIFFFWEIRYNKF